MDFAEQTTPDDVVTVVATRPLTRDETWTVVQPGALMVLRDGEPMAPRRGARQRG